MVTNDNEHEENSMSDAPEQDETVEPLQVEPLEESEPLPVEAVTASDDEPPARHERHEMPPRPAVPNRNPHKSSTQIAREVWDGQWGDDGWQERVAAAGFNAELVERLVNKGVGQN